MTERTAASLQAELSTGGSRWKVHPRLIIDLIDSVLTNDLVSDTELSYLDGVTSAIQTQLNNKQALDASLTAYAAVTTAADKSIYFTAADTPVAYDLTAAGRALLDDANAAAQIVTLGVNATAAELNAAADVSVRLVSVPDAGTYAALVANSGKPHVMPDLTSTCTITLPTPASGLEFEFIYKGVAADAANWVINTASNTNYFVGGLVHLDTDAGDAGDEIVPIAGNGSSNSKVTIVAPNVGTRVRAICDGTLWILSGYAVSVTVPSFADQ